MNAIVWETNLPGIHFLNRGKVRDLYEVGDRLLIVATDRLSAFDVVLPTPIPDKGRVLTQLSLFWFDLLRDIIPNHVSPRRISRPSWRRTARSSKAAPCFAGGRNPCRSNALCADTCPARDGRIIAPPEKSAGLPCRRGCANPNGCRKPFSRPRPRPPRATTKIFRSTKRSRRIGGELAERVRAVSLEIYRRAAAYAEPRGIILADTKFEFGLVGDELIWIDEALTPDSSRFWPADGYQPGRAQPSFDKQYVRDYLERIGWNKQPPGPELPPDVVAATRDKYREAYRQLTGHELK